MQTSSIRRALFLLVLSFLFLSFQSMAQSGGLSGKVTDETGAPLSGATITIRGNNQSARTNEQGEFSFANAPQNGTLVITYVGYKVQEVRYQNRNVEVITLAEAVTQADEVVVTGVFDRRKRMEASVAISTFSDKQLSRIVPSSSVDLLKNLPGVFVNSARGEIGSSVYTRGLSVGGGFFYVSMQEEGLPILVMSGAIQPDAYLRADATINRVEAVRGGTASILGANAPGGIFNYVSKVGGQKFAGEIRTRLGLEGNGRNPYFRGDVNFGGPLNSSGDLTYNVGGFYRHANGPKYPGYPLSFGGQVKGNIQKAYKSGTVKLYAKLLNDNTSQFEMTPTVDWNNPRPAGRFTNTSSTLIQPVQFTIPGAVWSRPQGLNWDSRNVGNYKDYAIGLNWEQRLGEGWTINNMARYSDKANRATTTQVVFPFRVDQLTFYGVSGNIGRFGTYNFYDPATGKSYGSVQHLPPTSPGPPRVIAGSLSLPGSEVLPNALFYNPTAYNDLNMTDFIDQLMVTKRLKNMSFTAGGYFSRSRIDRLTAIPAGQGFATIEDRPKLVGIKYTDLRGVTYDLSDRNGINNYGGSGHYTNNATVNQSALFFGHNWQLSDKLNFDWGVRYESLNINAKFTTPRRLPDSKTGADGDSLTIYDNRVWTSNPERGFDKEVNTFSYSAGLNYKVTDGLSFYGRYSKGRKSPDLGFFLDIANQQLTSDINPEAQDINMLEAGVKMRTQKMNLFVTPFYNTISNIPNFQIFQNPDLTYYAPPRRYQKVRTYGVEVEGAFEFSKNFSLRAIGVVQGAKALEYSVFLARTNGPQDDSLVIYNGNQLDNVPPVMLMLTPTYTTGPFFASINYQYMGKRWANVANAFQLPAFSQFDLNMGYTVSKRVQLNASINNVFNTYGVMSWAAPGGFPASLDVQGFTPQMRAANENSVYSTLSIMPRAYFLTATYRF